MLTGEFRELYETLPLRPTSAEVFVENSWKNSSMSQVAVSMSQVAVSIQWIDLRMVALETRLRTEDQAGKFRAGHDEGGFA